MNIIRDLPPKLPAGTWVGVDTEIFELNQHQMHRPTSGIFGCITVAVDDDVYFVDSVKSLGAVVTAIKDCVWCMQDAKFDITHMRRWSYIPAYSIKLFDTLLIEKILFGGYYDFFALQHLARRHLGIVVDKTLQKSFGSLHTMTEEQIQYACMDAWVTLKIAQEQKKLITASDWKIWQKVDLPALWAFLDFKGFAIDVDKWKVLAEKNKTAYDVLAAQLPFNPRSSQQCKANLTKMGFKRLKNTEEKSLQQAIAKYPDTEAAEIAKQILVARKMSKRYTTYGENWLDKYIEQDHGVNTICSDFNVTGAETGRTCIDGDTVLSTLECDVKIKDLDLTKDTKYHILTHNNSYKIIRRKIYKGKELMYGVSTVHGKYLECTGNHRILTPSGWRYVKDLRSGSIICTSGMQDRSANIEREKHRSRRRELRENGFDLQVKSNKDKGNIWNKLSHNGQFPAAIWKQIQKRNSKSKILPVCAIEERKHLREESYAICFDSPGIARTFSEFSSYCLSNSKYSWDERVRSKNECGILQDGIEWKASSKFAIPRYGILRAITDTCSWLNGCSVKLLSESRHLLSETIRGIFTGKSNGMVYQASSQSAFRQSWKIGNQESYMLELQHGRNASIFGVAGQQNTSYTPIQFPRKDISRFLCARKEFNHRGRWEHSWHCLQENQRRITRFINTIFGIQPNASDYRPSKDQYSANYFQHSGDRILSIVTVGVKDVWDIEVEGDHSYVAAGFIHHNSSSDPNMQNVPTREAPEYRECFVARPKHLLVIADYHQQEPNIMTYFSQDEKLLACNANDGDVYIELAKNSFQEEITKSDPRRKSMKTVFLGMCYGLSEYGLSLKEDITEEEAAHIMELVFRAFPTMASWINQQKKQKRMVHTIMGRKVHLNAYSGQCERNALNAPIQGSAADMMKMALSAIHRAWPFDCPFACVGYIHDEIVFDVPEEIATQVAEFVSKKMIEVAEEMCPGLKFHVDTPIGDNWRAKS